MNDVELTLKLSLLLKYEELKQQINEFLQISQKAYGRDSNVSQTLK